MLSNAQVVYNLLTTQRFVNWYENKFVPHIEGDEDSPSREEIVEWIEDEFRRIRFDK